MTEKIFIDATGAIFGRLCSFAAKKVLEGNEVIIVNSEKTIVTGNRNNIITKFSERRKKGRSHSLKGPKHSKIPYLMLKRGIRGMLPNHRSGIGKEALAKVKCYNNLPVEYKDKELLKIQAPKKIKFIEIKELAEKI